MPWCSKCFDEYVDSIKICPECGAKLVAEKPEPEEKPKPVPKQEGYVFYDDTVLDNEVLLIQTEDEAEFGFFSNALEVSEIPYRATIVQEHEVLEAYIGRSSNHKNIFVAKDDYDKATLACKEAANFVPLDVLPEDEITDEDVESWFSTIQPYIFNKLTYVFLGLAFVAFVVFLLIALL